MTRSTIIKCALSVLLMAYLVVAMWFAYDQASHDHYDEFRIDIHNYGNPECITADQIDRELGGLRENITKYLIDSINTQEIERRIQKLDNVESANCVSLNNGTLRLDVVPLIPVARVFDFDRGTSYYINRAGKQMKTSRHYRIDTPVILGSFPNGVSATMALPVLDYISENDDMAALISAVSISPKGDIMLVPMLKGHIVKFGATTDIANKFDRLRVFYRQVMPVKGWTHYDTISVKWRGQVVAHRHDKQEAASVIEDVVEDYVDDISTMSVDASAAEAEPAPEATEEKTKDKGHK